MSPAQLKIVVDLAPALAGIVRTVESPILGFNQSPDPPRPCWRGGNSHSALDSSRQTASQFSPALSAVGRFVEAIGRATAINTPGTDDDLPNASIENARVVGIDIQVGGTALLVHKENSLPVLPAILGSEDTPLPARPEDGSQRGHVDPVGISGIDADSGNVPGLIQANVAPGLSRILRFVNTISVRDVISQTGFSSSHIENIRIRRGNRDCAYRSSAKIRV